MSETPETDAEVDSNFSMGFDKKGFPNCYVSADFARSLETKLTEANARIAELLPWALLYRDNKTLGEIAEQCGGTAYDYSPWLTAPAVRIAMGIMDSMKASTTAAPLAVNH